MEILIEFPIFFCTPQSGISTWEQHPCYCGKVRLELKYILVVLFAYLTLDRKVYICDLSEEVVMPPHKFPLHEIGSSHIIGSLAWGHEVTSDELFASSEPTLRTFTGAHKVFDLRTQKSTYQFDAHEAGDAISVDATGERLLFFVHHRQ